MGENDGEVDLPDTRYAWNGDVALAYQVTGNGKVDLIYLPSFASNVEWNWESPRYRHMLDRLGMFSRLVAAA